MVPENLVGIDKNGNPVYQDPSSGAFTSSAGSFTGITLNPNTVMVTTEHKTWNTADSVRTLQISGQCGIALSCGFRVGGRVMIAGHPEQEWQITDHYTRSDSTDATSVYYQLDLREFED